MRKPLQRCVLDTDLVHVSDFKVINSFEIAAMVTRLRKGKEASSLECVGACHCNVCLPRAVKYLNLPDEELSSLVKRHKKEQKDDMYPAVVTLYIPLECVGFTLKNIRIHNPNDCSYDYDVRLFSLEF